MPVQECQSEGKPGYRWGETGACYTYTPGNDASRAAAKEKAAAQGRAIKSRQGGEMESLQPQSLQEQPSPEAVTYAMVALIPPAQVADQLVLDVDGAEPAELLHITLVYLGPNATAELDRTVVEAVVADICARAEPISGVFNGSAMFGPEGEGRTPDEAGTYPIVATFDAPGLGLLREALVMALREHVDYPPDTHGFCPHLTRAYVASPPATFPEPPMVEMQVGQVAVCWGDYVQDPQGLTMIPLGPVLTETEVQDSADLGMADDCGCPQTAAAPNERIDPDPMPSMGDEIHARGSYMDSPEGQEFRALVEGEAPIWPSVELADAVTIYETQEDGSELEVAMGAIGKVVCLTFQAQVGTWIRPDGDGWSACLVVNGLETRDNEWHRKPIVTGWYLPQAIGYWTGGGDGHEQAILGGTVEEITVVPGALPAEQQPATESPAATPAVPGTLAAAGPAEPPASWFDIPTKIPDIVPWTVTDQGQVYGLVAGPGCHVGLPGCVKAPVIVDYGMFNDGRGVVRTAEGVDVRVGPITLAGGHAPLYQGRRPVPYGEAVRHYDDSRATIAYVRVGPTLLPNGRILPYAAGVVRPDATPEQVAALRAHGVSGDWRTLNGRTTLAALLSVPVPGFPVMPKALVAAGVVLAEITAAAAVEQEDDMDAEALKALHDEWHATVQDPASTMEQVEPTGEFQAETADDIPARVAEAFAKFQGNIDALVEWACSLPGMTECIDALTGQEGIDDPARVCNFLRSQGGCLEAQEPEEFDVPDDIMAAAYAHLTREMFDDDAARLVAEMEA